MNLTQTFLVFVGVAFGTLFPPLHEAAVSKESGFRNLRDFLTAIKPGNGESTFTTCNSSTTIIVLLCQIKSIVQVLFSIKGITTHFELLDLRFTVLNQA